VEPDDLKIAISNVIAFDTDVRGTYLFKSTWIETLLNQIISYYFCSDDKIKRNQILSILIHDLNFSNKIRVFLNIMKSNYYEINKKHPELKKDLEQVRDWRNKFAHCMLDTTVEYIKKNTGKIRYEFYSDGKKQYLEITENSIHKKISEIENLQFTLLEILQIISKEDSGVTSYIGSL
jgi:hypothetical protein